jgi:hypothetical protein
MASNSSTSIRPDWQQALYAKPWIWLALLVCAHIVSRISISAGMKWDESEQILWAQHQLGYGPQPPLYTWMQWAVCQFSALRCWLWPAQTSADCPDLLPGMAGWPAVAQSERRLVGCRRSAADAALRLGLAARPDPYGDGDGHDHGLWWAVLRQVQKPQAINLSDRPLLRSGHAVQIQLCHAHRSAVRGLHDGDAGTSRHLRQGWWLAPLVGLLVFAPHAFWLASHWGMATTETVQKMSISTGLTSERSGQSAQGPAFTLGLWLIAAVLSYRSRLWKPAPRSAGPGMGLAFAAQLPAHHCHLPAGHGAGG